MGSEGPHGGLSLHSAKAGWSEATPQCEEGGHGVADPVPDGPIPSPDPRLNILLNIIVPTLRGFCRSFGGGGEGGTAQAVLVGGEAAAQA